MNPLEEYFRNNKDRVIHKWVHYFEIYHTYFQRFRDKECVILEIGVSMGGSLQMWKHYFGDNVKIYAIDIDPNCKQFEDESTTIFIGSQSNRKFLREVKEKIPKVDILIDDGGHRMDEQIITFEELYGHIKEDGIYLCEDTHTSYWEEYGGGYKKKGSFIEYTKSLIDHLNAWHSRTDQLTPGNISKSAHSFHFYDSVFVIEKRKREKPWDEMRGSYPHPYGDDINEKELRIFNLKLDLLGIELPENMIPEFLYENTAVLESLYPEKYEGKVWPEKGETMIGFKRLSNLQQCISDVIKRQVIGDFVEAGVWRGGASIFMRALLDEFKQDEKKVWLIDSFAGLPPPNEDLYPEDKGLNLHEHEELAVGLPEVKKNFEKYGLLDEKVEFIKGWFKDSLPAAPISKISILRLDGDLYESTIDALYHLYPKLSVGGYCIIDDWGAIPACKKAVEDFRRVYGINDDIREIDWTGVYWKKSKQIRQISYDQFMQKLRSKSKNGFFKKLFKKVSI